jgi:hypothetical protein
VFGENHPVYEARWESEPVDGAHQVVVTLTQFTRTQNPEFFTMPVDLRFSSDTRDTTITVFHTESGQQFSIRLPFEPRALEVDPDEWILKEISSPIPGLPSSFKLEQNFPNPFNAGTAISFHLPSRGTIRLEVFDIMGRRVATLADGQWEPGPHVVTWLGETDEGTPVASGVYVYRFSGASHLDAKTMLLLR